MAVHTLTDAKIRGIKPGTKKAKHFDGHGLFLEVMPNGTRTWRVAYRWQGKPREYVVGRYPAVGLAAARRQTQEVREVLASGRDPVLVRRTERAATAETQTRNVKWLVEEWLGVEPGRAKWDEKTTALVTQQLTDHVVAHIGHWPITDVTPMVLIDTLNALKAADKLETLRRVRQRLAQVFDMAVNRGLLVGNPAARLAREFSAPDVTHHPAVPEPEVPAFFRAIEARGNRMMELALWFTALTAQRTESIHAAEWPEVDFDAALWTIPPEKMKTEKGQTNGTQQQPHLVPLSPQAVAVLRQLHRISGRGRYLFPHRNIEGQPMSNNAMNMAVRRAGYKDKHTPHGFRTVFSTACRNHGKPHHVIEAVLDHEYGTETSRVYDRAQYLPEKRVLLDWYGAHLDAMTNQRLWHVVPE